MSGHFSDRIGVKRSRSRSPSSWRQPQKFSRKDDDINRGPEQQTRRAYHRDQERINRLQEDEQEREWVAQEDTFVLKQAKKKAEIRVKEGRAKPIDWLTVTLRVIDPTRNPLDDEISESELDLVDPDGVFEGLSSSELLDLEKDIDTFLSLETNPQNREFWKVRWSLTFLRSSQWQHANYARLNRPCGLFVAIVKRSRLRKAAFSAPSLLTSTDC